MKLSTLLLSSAALVVAGSAYAADLPAKKAAPAAKAATGCAAVGPGYFSIPGGDTCLKVSGYARFNGQYGSGNSISRPGNAPSSLGGGYGLNVYANTNSEAGAVNSRILIENASTTYARVAIGGLKAGIAEGLTDIGGGYNYAGSAYGSNVAQIQYTMPMGASSLGLAIASPANANFNGTSASGTPSRPDLQAMLTTTTGPVTVNLGGVSHEAVGSTSGSVQGYAAIGKVTFDAGVASIFGYAAYASGAAAYLGAGYTAAGTSIPYNAAYGVSDTTTTGGSVSSGQLLQAGIDIPVGKNSAGIFVESQNVTGTLSNAAASLTSTTVEAAFSYKVGGGLSVRPSIWTQTLNSASSTGGYLRIQRDF